MNPGTGALTPQYENTAFSAFSAFSASSAARAEFTEKMELHYYALLRIFISQLNRFHFSIIYGIIYGIIDGLA